MVGRTKTKKSAVDKLPQANDKVEEQEEEQVVENDVDFDERIAILNEKIAKLKDMSIDKSVKKVQETTKEEDENEELEREEEKTLPTPASVEKPEGTFNLNPEEMSLAVNALASSEEFKLYQQVILGQRISGVIQTYQEYMQQRKDDVIEEQTK